MIKMINKYGLNGNNAVPIFVLDYAILQLSHPAE
jgi:hypothetical protein